METKTKSHEEPIIFPQTLDEFYQVEVPENLFGFIPVRVVSSVWKERDAHAYARYMRGEQDKPEPTEVFDGSAWLPPTQLDLATLNDDELFDLTTPSGRIKQRIKEENDKLRQKAEKGEEGALIFDADYYLLEPDKVNVRNVSLKELTDSERETVKEFYIKRCLTKRLPEPEETADTANVSLTLANWFSRPKENEIQVYGKKYVPLKAELTDEKEGKVIFTKKQIKLLAALACYFSPYAQGEYFRKIIEEYRGGDNPFRFVVKLYVAEFIKEYVSSEGKARTEEIKKTLAEIYKLSKITTTAIYGEKENRKTTLKAKKKLFTIDESLEFNFDEEPTTEQDEERERDKLRSLEYISISFNPIFWYRLTDRYAILKKSIFKVWGTKGSGTDTELFAVVLFRLLEVFMYRVMDYYNSGKTAKNMQLKGAEYTKQRIKNEIKALSYTISARDIKDAIPTKDYDSTRQQKSTFWKDLNAACNIYKDKFYCGIITDYEVNRKDEKITFHFDLGYYPHKPKP